MDTFINTEFFYFEKLLLTDAVDLLKPCKNFKFARQFI